MKLPRLRPKDIPYWVETDRLPLLLNNLGLRGDAVEIGVSTAEFTSNMLRRWKGSKLHLIQEWRPTPISDWVDVRNFRTDAEWTESRTSFLSSMRSTKKHQRLNVIEKHPTEALAAFGESSLDVVWLNHDRSYKGTLDAISRTWPLLRHGGVLGGSRCEDKFLGDPHSSHSWHATRAALRSWSRSTGRAFFVSNDKKNSWLAFKTALPRAEDVLVISGASREVEYADVTSANHREYCQKWGHPYHLFGDADFDRTRKMSWSKIRMIRTALERSPWVFWIDCDAIFNDWSVPLTRLCIETFGLICGIWYYGLDQRPSAGTMMFQRGDWSHRFLNAVWKNSKFSFSAGGEEDAMWDVINKIPSMRPGMFCVDVRELNSPALLEWNAEDPIIHFLQLGKSRSTMLIDACQMAKDKNTHSAYASEASPQKD